MAVALNTNEQISLADRLERLSPDRMIGEKGTTFLYSEDVAAIVAALRKPQAGTVVSEFEGIFGHLTATERRWLTRRIDGLEV